MEGDGERRSRPSSQSDNYKYFHSCIQIDQDLRSETETLVCGQNIFLFSPYVTNLRVITEPQRVLC